MRALLQRVRWARVSVDGERLGAIDQGLLVLLGVGQGDGATEVDKLAQKVCDLRIFEDAAGKMNRSVLEIDGGVLVVSQFTLYGDCRKGRRPSFVHAEAPERASALCDAFAAAVRQRGLQVETGRFGAMMQVELCNDGPVTIWLDTAELSRPRRGG